MIGLLTMTGPEAFAGFLRMLHLVENSNVE